MTKPLKILSLSEWDHAGCAFQLAEAINDTTPHHCRAVKVKDNAFHYPYDMMGLTMQQMTLLWNWADVIHIHDSFPIRLPSTVAPRHTVITYHGTEYRKSPKQKNQQIKSLGWVGSVSTPDLTVHGLQWMPDCRPDLMQYVQRTVQFSIVHCPTREHIKGTPTVKAAITNTSLDIVMKMRWETCLQRKGRAWLTVDQFQLGYGCNAIEAWAMGQPVIAGGTSSIMRAIERHVGFIPFYFCAENVDEIRAAVQELMTDSEVYEETSKIGRLCWEKYHSPRATAKRALALYQQALDIRPSKPDSLPARPKAKGTLNLADGNVVEIRFIGHGTQAREVIGEVSGTHYRYSGMEDKSPRRNFYVYACDIDGILSQVDRRNKRLFMRVK